jgi:hypothetical protein
MCAFGKVLESCSFFHERYKKLSAEAEETISAKKGATMACNITQEIIVARTRKCRHWKGCSKNQAVTRSPPDGSPFIFMDSTTGE